MERERERERVEVGSRDSQSDSSSPLPSSEAPAEEHGLRVLRRLRDLVDSAPWPMLKYEREMLRQLPPGEVPVLCGTLLVRLHHLRSCPGTTVPDAGAACSPKANWTMRSQAYEELPQALQLAICQSWLQPCGHVAAAKLRSPAPRLENRARKSCQWTSGRPAACPSLDSDGRLTLEPNFHLHIRVLPEPQRARLWFVPLAAGPGVRSRNEFNRLQPFT